MLDELLTMREVANKLKLSAETVRGLPIARSRIGGRFRYRLIDVERYIISTPGKKLVAVDRVELSTPRI